VASLPRPEPGLLRTADFDALAGLYRWMEWLSFGPLLGMCRTAFLSELAEARSAVVLGDGDGRFTARLLRAAPGVRVEAVDASAAMLHALLRRAGENIGRVRPWHGDARFLPQEQPERVPFDLVATHFFLDCLTAEEIAALAHRIADSSVPGAQWVISEFAVPAGWFGRWVARPLVAFLYTAFGLLTGLEVRRLPDYAPGLSAAGFRPERRRTMLGGLLTAEVWRLRKS